MSKTSVQTATTNTTDMKAKEAKSMKKNNTVTINEILSQAATQQTEKAAKIRAALVERTAYVCAAKGCAIEPDTIRSSTEQFLSRIPDEVICGGADVVLRREFDATSLEHVLEGENVVLGWDANPQATEGKRPNVIWLTVKTAPKVEKTPLEKFLGFMANRCAEMTEATAKAVFEAAWDGEEITVCIHPKATPVVMASQKVPGGQFILQSIGAKGQFVPNRPIGYVTGNRVYVSIPGIENGRPWTFRLNPKRDNS